MGASTDPCATPEVTVNTFFLPVSLPVCDCSESLSPIPASSLAYRSDEDWLPDGGGAIRKVVDSLNELRLTGSTFTEPMLMVKQDVVTF